MDATIAFPTTIARTRQRTATGAARHHGRRARRMAAVVAIAAALLAATAGALIDGGGALGPTDPVPYPQPGLDIVLIIAR